MANTGGKLGMKVLTIAASIPIGIVTRKLVEQVWAAAGPKGDAKAESEGAQWADAIGWAALTAVGMAIADLTTRKAAQETYRTLFGIEPPSGEVKSKAYKKVAKAKPPHGHDVNPPD
jgi:Protein of unknown function (DUF4235)